MLTGGRGDAERYPTDDVTLRWKEAMFHVKHKHSPSVRLTGGKRGSITEVKPGHGNPKSAMFHVKHRRPSAPHFSCGTMLALSPRHFPLFLDDDRYWTSLGVTTQSMFHVKHPGRVLFHLLFHVEHP